MPKPEAPVPSLTHEPRSLLGKILSAGEGKRLRELEGIAEQVNSWEKKLVDLKDEELRAQTGKFRERLADGETLDDILPEAFATVREASKRVLEKRYYDVQVMGGAAIHFGNIAEMATGEGKTLAAVMPAYLNALTGKGVHVVTVNDYLAQRDANWMGRIYRFLDLSVGTVLPNRSAEEHRLAYECDITYGTNNEFGFDYLRDNMAIFPEDQVQRGHNFAILDEVDSILIDEAQTPLVISGPAEGMSTAFHKVFARLAKKMKEGKDYEIDRTKQTVSISDNALPIAEAKLEEELGNLGIDTSGDIMNVYLLYYLNNAIKAEKFFDRDGDYIVNDGDILIVDKPTGRILHGRRYNEGIHQAIEAKEALEVKQESQTLATITLQNYFRLYDKLSGMTGTAQTEAAEFHKMKLDVIPIPTHFPPIRIDRPDIVYKTEKAKFLAVAEEIAKRHATGQPILVGTTSVENSEILAELLRRKGIILNVLNAKNHTNEAKIVAQAGRKGGVTVATNMAGRGTDILLGGNPEFMAKEELARRGIVEEDDLEAYEKALERLTAQFQVQTDAEYEEVKAAGGLYVIGTARHESRRIDNQLRGRSGRQGDPGESISFLSLQDPVMRIYPSLDTVMGWGRIPDDVPLQGSLGNLGNLVKKAQIQFELHNAEARRNLLKYDNIFNEQRKIFYHDRQGFLDGKADELHENVYQIINKVVDDYFQQTTLDRDPWTLQQVWQALTNIHAISFSEDEFTEQAEAANTRKKENALKDQIKHQLRDAYDKRVKDFEKDKAEGTMSIVERQILLAVWDKRWQEHLYKMDDLREGVGFRVHAQRNPLDEYNVEGFKLFNLMKKKFREEAVNFLFNVQIN